MSGYLRNCYIKCRPGGPEPFKGFVPYLNGYAIVPTEDYLDREAKWPDRAVDHASQLGHSEPVSLDGYVCHCFGAGRDGDGPLFSALGDRIEAQLDSYTVVPLEEFIR